MGAGTQHGLKSEFVAAHLAFLRNAVFFLFNLLYLVTFGRICSSRAYEMGTHSMLCSMSCQSLLSLALLVFSSQYVPD